MTPCRNVTIPSVYIAPYTGLITRVRTSIQNQTVQLRVRTLGPDSTIIQQYNVPGDRAYHDYHLRLDECSLVGVNVFAAGNIAPGSCYVLVSTRTTKNMDQAYGHILISSYVSGDHELTWPEPRFMLEGEGPGNIRTILGTDPPAGSFISETVPSGARWKLLGVFASLATDGTAGNRYVYLDLVQGGYIVWRGTLTIAQPASTTYYYFWGIGVGFSRGPTENLCYDSLPADITMKAGSVVQVRHFYGSAGDNFGAPLLYLEEWVEP